MKIIVKAHNNLFKDLYWKRWCILLFNKLIHVTCRHHSAPVQACLQPTLNRAWKYSVIMKVSELIYIIVLPRGSLNREPITFQRVHFETRSVNWHALNYMILPGAGAILGFSQWGCSLRAKRAAKIRPRPLPGSRPLFSRWCTATVLTVFYSAISKSRMFTTRSSIRLGWQTLANSS